LFAGIFLSKVISAFVMPLGLCFCMAVIGTLVASRRRNTGVGLIILAGAQLWLFATTAFSSFLVASLEKLYPPVGVDAAPAADAIVILGGAVGVSDAPGTAADLTDTSDRVYHAARLYKAGKAPLVMATSGSAACEEPAASEAGAIRWLLEQLGVPERAVVSVSGSANTATDADAALIKQAMAPHGVKRVLLVTSATHMRRALAVFRRAGIDAVPSPTDYEEMECPKPPAGRRVVFEYLPDADALAKSTKAVNEYVGRGGCCLPFYSDGILRW
jgi:uncharacterized SAM-binding protein YcdF (DUF218 family)